MYKLILPIALITLFVFSAAPFLAIASPNSSEFDVVDDYIEKFMRDYRIPGLSLAVVKGDQVVYVRGFGVADPSARPVTAQTPFIVGSTSKSITALAMLQLVDAGKVDLDDPVQTYLSWFTLGNGKISVRHLLNHTSGIPTAVGQESLLSTDSDVDALERQVRRINTARLIDIPGSTYEYANANYEVAGLIIQVVSGQSYESYAQQSIFEPLDVRCSYTSKVDAQKHGLAEGYHYWFGLPLPAGNTPYPRQKTPSGYLVLCAEDMAHTLIVHLNDGKYRDKQIVSAAAIAELHRPALAGYAMGWQQGGNGILLHTGSVPDYGSEIMLDPSHDIGIVILFNINNAVGAESIYLENCVVLPHIAGHSVDARARQGRYAAEDILNYLAGRPLRFQVAPERFDTMA